MLQLKEALTAAGKTQRELAQHLQISPAGVAQICNHGIFPKQPDGKTVKAGVLQFLKQHGASLEVCRRAFEAIPQVGNPQKSQEETMLLRKQTLTPAAKKHFALFRDPFAEGVSSSADLFMSSDSRYVLESMLSTARHGGFVAIVGESGAGKSTLLEEMEEQLQHDSLDVTLIKPFVIGMEGDDTKGKRLKAASIMDAILRTVAPDTPRRTLSLEDKSSAAFEALQAKAKANKNIRHCLIIEEAHRLAVPTLKHLKGFYEMKIGRTPLLSIVMVGQTELGQRLTPSNTHLREVVQRCEVVHLEPLDSHLEAFIKFKFDRIGKLASEVIDTAGIEQIRDKMTPRKTDARGNTSYESSLLYPLAVTNLLIAAMNEAARLGVPVVNADVVKNGVKL